MGIMPKNAHQTVESNKPLFLVQPFFSDENAYVNRMVGILRTIGVVAPVPSFKSFSFFKFLFSRKKADCILVGWLENGIVGKNGRFVWRGVLKVFFKAIVFRFLAKRLVFIKHNLYPHGTRSEDAKRAKYASEWLEMLFNSTIVHSPHLESARCFYVPHPLYRFEELSSDVSIPDHLYSEKYYVVFGRVEPYKNIHSLLKSIPNDVALVIMGRASDRAYLNELKAVAGAKVTFISDFVSDDFARKVILCSSGVVVCHQEPNIIVSGTFFYALSLGVRVYSLATPFLKSIELQVGSEFVSVSDSMDELADCLSNKSTIVTPESSRNTGVGAFGDDLIRERLVRALDI